MLQPTGFKLETMKRKVLLAFCCVVPLVVAFGIWLSRAPKLNDLPQGAYNGSVMVWDSPGHEFMQKVWYVDGADFKELTQFVENNLPGSGWTRKPRNWTDPKVGECEGWMWSRPHPVKIRDDIFLTRVVATNKAHYMEDRALTKSEVAAYRVESFWRSLFSKQATE
jgi:hypothetical protein